MSYVPFVSPPPVGVPSSRVLAMVVRVLLVVTLIGLGAAAGFELGYRWFRPAPRSLQEATELKARMLASELELELSRTGHCADALTELVRRGYAPTLRADPWGTPWRVRCYAERGTVESAGPDRSFATVDDIVALTSSGVS